MGTEEGREPLQSSLGGVGDLNVPRPFLLHTHMVMGMLLTPAWGSRGSKLPCVCMLLSELRYGAQGCLKQAGSWFARWYQCPEWAKTHFDWLRGLRPGPQVAHMPQHDPKEPWAFFRLHVTLFFLHTSKRGRRRGTCDRWRDTHSGCGEHTQNPSFMDALLLSSRLWRLGRGAL